MKIDITENGGFELSEVYSGVRLKSKEGEMFSICMRDSGFEFMYNDIWYSAKEGVITKIGENNE